MIKEKTWTDVIIIRSIDYGESDRILGLFTRELGNVSIFARGARNSKKRYVGMDLFASFRTLIVPPKIKSGTFFQAESVENLDLQLDVRQDIHKFCQMSYMAECTWLFLGELDAQPEYFDWWKKTIETMRQGSFTKNDQAKIDLEMLRWFGYLPSFQHCYECEKKVEHENVFFSFSKGGIVCRLCHRPSVGRWLHSDSFLNQDVSSLRESLDDFVRFTLGKQPRSQKIREEMVGGYRAKIS